MTTVFVTPERLTTMAANEALGKARAQKLGRRIAFLSFRGDVQPLVLV